MPRLHCCWQVAASKEERRRQTIQRLDLLRRVALTWEAMMSDDCEDVDVA
jgi:hypothetical protein